MPVVQQDPDSPPRNRVHRSPSPDCRPEGRSDEAGPSKKPKLTTNILQARRLEKLFLNPDKEIQMPQPTREKTIRAPAEMMKNVQGSVSGAGSGEFHVYKASRRREYERLKIMGDQTRALDEQAAFQARQAERDAAADAKTAKNRAKRQKRKAGRKGGDTANAAAPAAGGGLKRLGGAGVVFKRPGEESDDEEDDDEDAGGVGPTMPAASEVSEAPAPARVVEEGRILIHDDE